MKLSQSHYGSFHCYVMQIGRLRIEITNRLQLFEERRLPSLRGWWIGIVWCRRAGQ
jgi:hypothetical protein